MEVPAVVFQFLENITDFHPFDSLAMGMVSCLPNEPVEKLIFCHRRTFTNCALADLWAKGKSAKIDARLHYRILLRLDRLDAIQRPEEMNLPGFDFH